MKIYTRHGDKGNTQLIGSSMVSKDDNRVEAYGTVDELNSWIGYTRSVLGSQLATMDSELEEIQQLLFDIGRDLATLSDDKKHDYFFTDAICKKQTQWLEDTIDRYVEAAPAIDRFILPGGTSQSAALHVARTVTRRAERQIVTLQKQSEINPNTLVFINRLSDYFFAAARFANHTAGIQDVTYRNGNPVFKK
ncbi:cob(I)yrinic acid a,c-diamide adenosyltransferase [uncultured Secundilactobacillus sp.]|uniref:cob(I)yrinic acid a,c-diamide adenosyltransferase n=1 Tax=uncultured Secundilactobacillus sp. TaxID=2813935 RepID=UPI0025895DB9|nr:cob(I)yrinic acid a,c-diamide adenosyltransferase [uncultured Secundilactobacillus sp.]